MTPQPMTAETDREWWAELEALAESGDVKNFYRRYADYLEAAFVYSGRRRILVNMARKASNDT